MQKLKKKEKIELFFRENRIKKYDYANLYQQKLAASTLVSKACDNGKGFQESDRVYRPQHTKALAECEFTTTVREANRIFYRNYSGNLKSVSVSDRLLRVVWLPTLIFVALGLTLPFASFPYEELLLLAILIVVVVLLASAALLAFLAKPYDNNQIEQSIEDVRDYFQQINQRFALQDKRIEWLCPTDFMYLEVVFYDGLPT